MVRCGVPTGEPGTDAAARFALALAGPRAELELLAELSALAPVVAEARAELLAGLGAVEGAPGGRRLRFGEFISTIYKQNTCTK